MGCATSKIDGDEKTAVQQNANIEKDIRQDKKRDSRTVKILLLGAGESGKSTIIKQMRIIHDKGFPDEEKRQVRSVIYSNMIVAFRLLLEIMNNEDFQFSDEGSKVHAKTLEIADSDVDADEAFKDQNVKLAMKSLWIDSGIQQAVRKGHEFALHDNLGYYFHNMDRMFLPGYLPDNQDMLHARLRTTGITETLFEMRSINFRMMDVGGQRSERKKWIHCFEGVQCLLFMVALSGYDQCLVEDQNANQMHESMMLFESLVNGEWFKKKPIILFLNKIDLFKGKLKTSPISKYFPDYTGGDTNEKAATTYFADRFRGINRNTDREIYIHFTNATDTTLLKATMQSVQDMIVQKNLSHLILDPFNNTRPDI